jgi:hypothetical protein
MRTHTERQLLFNDKAIKWDGLTAGCQQLYEHQHTTVQIQLAELPLSVLYMCSTCHRATPGAQLNHSPHKPSTHKPINAQITTADSQPVLLCSFLARAAAQSPPVLLHIQ